MYLRIKLLSICLLFIVIPALQSCRQQGSVTTGFYYWKTSFNLNQQQNIFLQKTDAAQLYVHFFDINWDNEKKQAYPNAIVRFNGLPTAHCTIIPVIYITNKTFENMADTAISTLAKHCNELLGNIAYQQKITFRKIQIDCDWTLTTRYKYFHFLEVLKKTNTCQLQATIRLHQIKYKDRTGVPPVDTGILMFYNMGKLNADLRQPNSIYNKADAKKYIPWLKAYPLKLNVALPLFSWALHIRDGKVIQVYSNIDQTSLKPDKFLAGNYKNCYQAKQSLFLNGIYVKQNDIFKLEETTANSLSDAADQLVNYLPKQQHRTVIYYELANINPSEFKPEIIKHISDSF